MKKQIKLVVAAFAIMLVGVTSVFAKNPGDPVTVSQFTAKAFLGVYEGAGRKMAFVADGQNVRWKYLERDGEKQSDTYILHWANNDENDDLMRVFYSGNMKFYFRFDTYENNIKLVDKGTLKLKEAESELLERVWILGTPNDNPYVFNLIDKGADVNHYGGGTTALHEAVKAGNFALAKKLIEKGANTNRKDKKGRTPADIATEKGYNKLADYIRNPKSFTPPDPTFFIEAAKNGDSDFDKTIDKYVAAGGDVNAYDERGWTALAYAATYGRKWIISYLISYGADINKQTKSKDGKVTGSPLYYAARQGKLECVEELVEAGAQVQYKINDPLKTAQEKGHTEIVNYLKDYLKKNAY